MTDEPQEFSSKLIREGVWRGENAHYRADQIIVRLKPLTEESDTALESLYSEIAAAIPQGTVLHSDSETGHVLFSISPSADTLNIIEQISNRDDVEYAEPNFIDTGALIPNDPRYVDQWAFPKIKAPEAWDLETGSLKGVLIGIIDSGISMDVASELDHPDLKDINRYILGTSFVDKDNERTLRDLNGHGTHVTGIAAAESNTRQGITGMNWGTPVYICKVLDAQKNGNAYAFKRAVKEIVDYAVSQGLKAVINYSSGGAGLDETRKEACEYANNNGMVICAAVGNIRDGKTSVLYPAAYSKLFDGVIAVGAINKNGSVLKSSRVGPEVTVVAPGESILSTLPTYDVGRSEQVYGVLDGTSMSTPFVTGLVSLLWSRHPNLTNGQIRECLTSTADKLDAKDFDEAWGYGCINAERALRYIDEILDGKG